MYHHGLGGIQKDLNKAFHWAKRAAKQRYAPAQYVLAAMYAKGEGTQQDLHKAFRWVKKAAEQGHTTAQYQLARMYYEGEGTEQKIPPAQPMN